MYLDVVGGLECRIVRTRDLLMIIYIATQHGCQGTTLQFYLLIGLWFVCSCEQIRNLKQLTYTLEN